MDSTPDPASSPNLSRVPRLLFEHPLLVASASPCPVLCRCMLNARHVAWRNVLRRRVKLDCFYLCSNDCLICCYTLSACTVAPSRACLLKLLWPSLRARVVCAHCLPLLCPCVCLSFPDA